MEVQKYFMYFLGRPGDSLLGFALACQKRLSEQSCLLLSLYCLLESACCIIGFYYYGLSCVISHSFLSNLFKLSRVQDELLKP